MQQPLLIEAIYAHLAPDVDALNWADLQRVVEYARQDALHGGAAHQLRACLPLLAARAVGGEVEQALPVAASWELAYWAAAVLDDLVDRDHPNRPWHMWPTERSLAIGVGLLLASQRCLIGQPADLLSAVSEALLHMTCGQATPPPTPTLEAYFEYITRKTGVFFAAFMWAGARTATSDPDLLRALYDYGMAIGLLAQVQDDNTWPSVTADLAQGIYTLPVIYGLTQTTGPAQAELSQWAALTADEAARAQLRVRLVELGAPNYGERMAQAFADQARIALAPLPATQAAPLLTWLGES